MRGVSAPFRPMKATRRLLTASAAVLCVFAVTPAHAAALSFVQNFGSGGFDSGQFQTPFGVAVDSAGNVWVADEGNNRIVELTGAAPAPEPTSAALLLGGGALLALRRRRSAGV